ncbi:hypothetical protein F5X68DRAFT_230304 [Plectosphaerella plurivora]|uniref:Uncharacterized protein n=1 Tax=Plectosphaerella plurivora TaxID=936078 RepID=A0A9P9ABZ2_9PEZI|nr:hypothetical protein F5X68DRAFT_230304 [Plectosphaerella plurivora]
MSRRLLHLRKFAVVAWTMLRGQGLLHGNRMNAELCERDATRDDSNARRMLPNGLMRGRVPSLARFIGSTTEPGNNSTEQEEDTFKDFFKLFELGPPEIAYGFPSMDLLAQKLDRSFTSCHEPNEGLDGVYDAFVKGELHNLRLMTNQISLLERNVNAEIQRGRIHVRPKDFEAEVQRSRVWRFIDKFDKFNFEDYVTKETLAAIHSRVLGIRDTNAADMETETTLGQASNLVWAFLIELDERMFADDADVIVLYRNVINQQLKNPGEEYAVSAALIFADGGSFENDDPWRPNLHWGEIHTPDPQDDDLMNLGHMDLSDSSGDSDDNGPPDEMNKNTKPAKKDDPRVKIPDKKIKENTNHKPPRSPKWEKTPGSRKSKPRTNDTLNLDDSVDGGNKESRKLRRKHIVTAETVFADESGSVHVTELTSLLQRMGFYMTEAAGSVFTIRWTPAVLLPNLSNHTTYTLHGPHGVDGEYWHGRGVARLARNLRTMGITWELIEQTYFGPGGPNARMVLTLGWSTSEDDWSVDGDKSEEEEMGSPATEVLEAVEVNGVGKRRQEDDEGGGARKRRREDDEDDEEEEGGLRGFKKIRSVQCRRGRLEVLEVGT